MIKTWKCKLEPRTKATWVLKDWRLERLRERIFSIFLVVRHVEELLGAAFDEAVQRVLHQLQVLQLCPGLLPVLPQEAGDLTASSGRQSESRFYRKAEKFTRTVCS